MKNHLDGISHKDKVLASFFHGRPVQDARKNIGKNKRFATRCGVDLKKYPETGTSNLPVWAFIPRSNGCARFEQCLANNQFKGLNKNRRKTHVVSPVFVATKNVSCRYCFLRRLRTCEIYTRIPVLYPTGQIVVVLSASFVSITVDYHPT